MHEQGFLSFKNAARWADVSCRTLERWVLKGLPIHQAPGEKSKRLIRLAELEQFLQRRQLAQPNLSQLVNSVASELLTQSSDRRIP